MADAINMKKPPPSTSTSSSSSLWLRKTFGANESIFQLPSIFCDPIYFATRRLLLLLLLVFDVSNGTQVAAAHLLSLLIAITPNQWLRAEQKQLYGSQSWWLGKSRAHQKCNTCNSSRNEESYQNKTVGRWTADKSAASLWKSNTKKKEEMNHLFIYLVESAVRAELA